MFTCSGVCVCVRACRSKNVCVPLPATPPAVERSRKEQSFFVIADQITKPLIKKKGGREGQTETDNLLFPGNLGPRAFL